MGIQINGQTDIISASDGGFTLGGTVGVTSITPTYLTVNGNAYPSAGPLSNRNKIINGDMRIDQRNAGGSVTINASSVTYSVDRWAGFGMATAGVFTLTRSTTAPAGFTNSLAVTCTTADGTIAAGDRYFIDHRIEGFNAADLDFGAASANTVTLSFWVQSSLTGTYCVALLNSAGNRSYVAEYTINTADTWEYKTITLTGDTSGTWLSDNGIGVTIRFTLATGTTYQTTANAWSAGNFNATSNQVNWMSSSSSRTFRITGVQLEVGSVATPFEHRSYGDELARCERYCQSFGPIYGIICHNYTTTNSVGQIKYKTTMRTNPTAYNLIAYNDAGTAYYSASGIARTLTSLTFNNARTSAAQILIQGTLGTAGHSGHLDLNASDALIIQAEL